MESGNDKQVDLFAIDFASFCAIEYDITCWLDPKYIIPWTTEILITQPFAAFRNHFSVNVNTLLLMMDKFKSYHVPSHFTIVHIFHLNWSQ